MLSISEGIWYNGVIIEKAGVRSSMSYKANPIKVDKDGYVEGTQTSMFSYFDGLTPRYKRDLLKGWAGHFRLLIMPNIDEAPYKELYSDLPGRANTPVNWMIGAEILKAIKHIPNDDDLRAKLCFDMEYRYALACENCNSAPFSDNVLSNFRGRCIQHYLESGTDLIYNTFVSIRKPLEQLMEIDPTLVRMDSTMIAASIRNMNRLALLYTSNELMLEAITGLKVHLRPQKTKTIKSKADIVNGQICITEMTAAEREAEKKLRASIQRIRAQEVEDAKSLLPEELHHYLNKEDENIVFYHNKEQSYDGRIKQVISETLIILKLCGEHAEYRCQKQYEIFVRIFTEQCKRNEDGTYSLREKGEGMSSDMIQSPYDTEATYRNKDGESYKGYAVAFSQAQNADGENLLMDYEVDTNNVSDQELGTRIIKRMDTQKEGAKARIVGDSLFLSDEMKEAAEERNYEIVNTNLTGKRPPDHCADHEFDEEGSLTRCAGGAIPTTSKLNRDGSCTAKIEKSACDHCPHKEECGYKEQKNNNSLRISMTTMQRAKEVRNRNSEEFKRLSHFRNGVESVPSLLKNKYGVNGIRGAGVARRKFQVGIDCMAMIAKQGMAFLARRVNYALY